MHITRAFLIFLLLSCATLKNSYSEEVVSIPDSWSNPFAATTSYETEEEIYDPFEKFNRKIYSFNNTLDKYALRPIAKGYRWLPKPIRKTVRNFITNITTPLTMVNSLLQGDVQNTSVSFRRFVINTIAGVGGLFDVATPYGLRHRKEDFGQTLGAYGIEAGPYLMLPVLGPSNTRDFTGTVTDTFINPVWYIEDPKILSDDEFRIGLAIVSGVDKRESLLEVVDDIERNSLDPYSAIRSAYTQRRDYEVNNSEKEE
jgi:phospholipid-binding lipoprotein MlaA